MTDTNRRAQGIIRELASFDAGQCMNPVMCWGPGKRDEGMTHCLVCALVREARRYLRHLPKEK